MTVSGTISTTTFNTNKVVDTAFRRCRLKAQNITSEMQSYALSALYLLLSELANPKPPSWCIERIMLPMYSNQPVVTLPAGTVEVLNVNYRSLQPQEGDVTTTSTSYEVYLNEGDSTIISTVGIKWSAAAVDLTFQVSDDGAAWNTVGTQTTTAAAGEWTWTDIAAAQAHTYFRVTSVATFSAETVLIGNSPQEIPLGQLNRDTYSAQSNKIFAGRPATFWFQRQLPLPVLNLWPAPNPAAELAQLIIWRHRHIMDVGTLAQDIEVPQRWFGAICAKLASKVAAETPEVDINLLPILEAQAQTALAAAWAGDNDGSSTFFQPRIGCYTR